MPIDNFQRRCFSPSQSRASNFDNFWRENEKMIFLGAIFREKKTKKNCLTRVNFREESRKKIFTGNFSRKNHKIIFLVGQLLKKMTKSYCKKPKKFFSGQFCKEKREKIGNNGDLCDFMRPNAF